MLWLEHRGAAYHKAYGNRALVPAVEPMTEDTIFDAASLTKVVACTPAIMLLVERGQVKLDEPVQTYIPEFKGEGKETITVRQLMLHTSGLRADIETKTDWHGQQTAIQKACAEKLQTPPGTAFRYSDINFFLLGEIVQRVSHTPLEEFVAREIYQPLKMVDTGYLPPESKLKRIAPTEVVNGTPYRGVVHDPTARHMGGVAGHAGLFLTAADLARYARMLLNQGALDGVRIFKPETVRLMTTVQTPGHPCRGAAAWAGTLTRATAARAARSSRSAPTATPAGRAPRSGLIRSRRPSSFSSPTAIIPAKAATSARLRARLGTLAAEALRGSALPVAMTQPTPCPRVESPKGAEQRKSLATVRVDAPGAGADAGSAVFAQQRRAPELSTALTCWCGGSLRRSRDCASA